MPPITIYLKDETYIALQEKIRQMTIVKISLPKLCAQIIEKETAKWKEAKP